MPLDPPRRFCVLTQTMRWRCARTISVIRLRHSNTDTITQLMTFWCIWSVSEVRWHVHMQAALALTCMHLYRTNIFHNLPRSASVCTECSCLALHTVRRRTELNKCRNLSLCSRSYNEIIIYWYNEFYTLKVPPLPSKEDVHVNDPICRWVYLVHKLNSNAAKSTPI